ncbi:uncharacterized protein PITG_08078 [Phytophthora infestans T30-4]|uniref:Uncharacterized protein n=1 Tax=Phytophthora infestans (strain T30-4) TaxID=403677 RepID=D0N9E7_PHYIT|nr:uncharacterized protein PITG_08078 [Phytophthora infestans T30-4]EEY54435.1 conserved hypothetical protein [Phytophthora infestans T30-4]|eukprot:XP_002904257.1 conserved hypothetical protein [Phytophthora infestans T30-4]
MSAAIKRKCSFATQSACGSSIITSECSSSPYIMRVTTRSVSTAGFMSVAVTDCASHTAKSAGAITKSVIITTSTSSRVVADKSASATATNFCARRHGQVRARRLWLVLELRRRHQVRVHPACENGTTATSAGFTTTSTSASDLANITTGTTKSASQHTFSPIVQTAVAVWSRRS